MRIVSRDANALTLLERALEQMAAIITDAPAYQRLAGWFGRDPAWTPPGNPAGREGPGYRPGT
jgi:hypothetical protein